MFVFTRHLISLSNANVSFWKMLLVEITSSAQCMLFVSSFNAQLEAIILFLPVSTDICYHLSEIIVCFEWFPTINYRPHRTVQMECALQSTVLLAYAASHETQAKICLRLYKSFPRLYHFRQQVWRDCIFVLFFKSYTQETRSQHSLLPGFLVCACVLGLL